VADTGLSFTSSERSGDVVENGGRGPVHEDIGHWRIREEENKLLREKCSRVLEWRE